MPKIDVTWNQIINAAMMILQAVMVGNVVTTPKGIRIMIVVFNVLHGLQKWNAGTKNADGSDVANQSLIEKTEIKKEIAIEPRKDVPGDAKP